MATGKENYLLSARDKLGWTRKRASEATGGLISEDKLFRMETELNKSVDPEDVLLLAKAYNAPALVRQYCMFSCPIGQQLNGSREAFGEDVSNIVLNILHVLRELQAREGQLIRIFRDEKLEPAEKQDFWDILAQMNELKLYIESLQLWVNTREK